MKRIFLVGCPRSGTTLLQSMLASHPKMVSFPETHLFSETIPFIPIFRPLKVYNMRDRQKLNQLLDYVDLPIPYRSLPGNTVFRTRQWAQILLKNLDNLAKYQGGEPLTYWLEKTPRHLHYIDLIHTIDPECRFIHIIRDGKDVVASLYEATNRNPKAWKGARSLKKAIFWWNRSVKNSEKYIGRSKHHHLLYEDLIKYPLPTLQKLVNKLGITMDKRVINSFHQTSSSLISEDEDWKYRNENPELSFSNKFEQFSNKQKRFITQRLYPFNYELIGLNHR